MVVVGLGVTAALVLLASTVAGCSGFDFVCGSGSVFDNGAVLVAVAVLETGFGSPIMPVTFRCLPGGVFGAAVGAKEVNRRVECLAGIGRRLYLVGFTESGRRFTKRAPWDARPGYSSCGNVGGCGRESRTLKSTSTLGLP